MEELLNIELHSLASCVEHIHVTEEAYKYIQRNLYSLAKTTKLAIYINEDSFLLADKAGTINLFTEIDKRTLDLYTIHIVFGLSRTYELSAEESNFIRLLRYLYSRDNYIEANFVQLL